MFLLRAVILFFSFCLPLHAQVLSDLAPPPELNSRAFLLIDLQSGAVLAERNADERIEPASLTKLMTAYLAFEALYQKRITMQQKLPVSVKAWRAPGSRMFLEPDTEVTVEALLKGLIASARTMDLEAQRLGLSNTNFVNATGLPDPQHYSSARDLE